MFLSFFILTDQHLVYDGGGGTRKPPKNKTSSHSEGQETRSSHRCIKRMEPCWAGIKALCPGGGVILWVVPVFALQERPHKDPDFDFVSCEVSSLSVCGRI